MLAAEQKELCMAVSFFLFKVNDEYCEWIIINPFYLCNPQRNFFCETVEPCYERPPSEQRHCQFDFDMCFFVLFCFSVKDKPAPISRNKSACCEHKMNTRGS